MHVKNKCAIAVRKPCVSVCLCFCVCLYESLCVLCIKKPKEYIWPEIRLSKSCSQEYIEQRDPP